MNLCLYSANNLKSQYFLSNKCKKIKPPEFKSGFIGVSFKIYYKPATRIVSLAIINSSSVGMI